MYNNRDGESDRYENKRRDPPRGDREDPNSKYKSRRNRWDEKEPESGTGSSRSRWDVKETESRNSRNRWDESERQPDSGHSRSRWNDKAGDSSRTSLETGAGAREPEHESSTNLSRSRDRKRSRSRSRSPFRRDFRNYANPTKDGYSYQSDLSNHSSSSQSGKKDNTSTRKQTSWSDSSDEDNDRSGKSNTFRNSTRSPGQPSQRHFEDYQNHKVPSLDIHTSKQATTDKLGSSSSSGISLKLGGSAVVNNALNDDILYEVAFRGSKKMGKWDFQKPTPLPKVISVPVPVKSTKVAAVFADSDDDEPEEMPPECKMRMKNVGRETRTSEGPNSFGKTKIGFCNMSHLAEKHLEDKGAGGGANKKA